MADWAGLARDILYLIATRLSNHPNYYGFTAVCSSWRSIGIEHHRRNFPRQCLGLITPGRTTDAETRYFVQLFAENINPAPLQLPVPHKYYCCGSTLGWLVYIDDSYDMQLFNPFSRKKIQLPSSANLPPPPRSFTPFNKFYVEKAILSSDPMSTMLSETILLIIYGGIPSIAFCRLGDTTWTVVENTKRDFYQDAIYFKEKFYVVYCPGTVVACDFSNNQQTVTEYAPKHQEEKILDKRYLVEMDGELHQVVKMIQFVPTFDDVEDADDEDEDEDEDESSDGSEEEVPGYQAIEFIVLKLEESGESRKWVEVKSIGDNALFLGYNASFSLSTLDIVGCKRNCIYFTNDKIPFDWKPERMDRIIAMYNLEDGSAETLNNLIESQLKRPPPLWFTPNPW